MMATFMLQFRQSLQRHHNFPMVPTDATVLLDRTAATSQGAGCPLPEESCSTEASIESP